MSTSRNEMALFEALTGWLRYSVGNRQKYLSSTMALIKFRKVCSISPSIQTYTQGSHCAQRPFTKLRTHMIFYSAQQNLFFELFTSENPAYRLVYRNSTTFGQRSGIHHLASTKTDQHLSQKYNKF